MRYKIDKRRAFAPTMCLYSRNMGMVYRISLASTLVSRPINFPFGPSVNRIRLDSLALGREDETLARANLRLAREQTKRIPR